MEVPKKLYVPFEEALSKAGLGLYTNYVIVVTGLVIFSALLGIQVMSIVLPVAGCELALTSYQKGLLTSTPFAGMMFASFLFGFLADMYGRRRVMLWSGSCNILLTLLTSLISDPTAIMVLWTVNGFFLGGVFTPSWVYVSEFCPPEIRARCILIPAGISSLGQVYLPFLAWLILPVELSVSLPTGLAFSSWRLYVALIAVPTALSWLMLYKLPESPKFALNKGQEQEALETLRGIYALNNRKTKEEFPVDYLCLDLADMMASRKEADGGSSCSSFISMLWQQVASLFTPPLLLFSLLSIAVLVGAIGTYNTLILWFPEQMRVLMQENTKMEYEATLCDVMSSHLSDLSSGSSACELDFDIFIISMITALLQSILFIVISIIADKVGRKLLMILFSALSSAACVGLIYANTFLLTVSSLSLTVIMLSFIFPVSYSVVLDFFPTSLRSTASSLTMLFGRFAAGAGSQVFGAMFENYCVQAYWGMASLLLCTLAISIVIPTKREL